MQNRFEYFGGTHRQNKEDGSVVTDKFFVFAMMEDVEFILYEATKKGIFYREHMDISVEKLLGVYESDEFEHNLDSIRGDVYQSTTPLVKVFMSSMGFGSRKLYYSFFIRLNKNSTDVITIRPFGFEANDFIFRTAGTFLTTDEIKALVGEGSPTYGFFKRQTFLSKAELNHHVSLEKKNVKPKLIRHLRI